jgi:hypothetical protein
MRVVQYSQPGAHGGSRLIHLQVCSADFMR